MKKPVFLRIFKNQDLVGVKQFTSDQIVIGREGDVHLLLEDASVSPIHSMIESREDAYYVCDLGSGSGTILNQQTVLDHRLESGDELKIGNYTVEFFIGIPKPKTKPNDPPTVIQSAANVNPQSTPPGVVSQTVPVSPVSQSTPVKPELPPELPTERPTLEQKKAPKAEPKTEPKTEPTKIAPKASEAPKNAMVRPQAPQEKKPKQSASAGLESVSSSAPQAVDSPSFSKKRTFAPTGQTPHLKEVLTPSKGSVLEIVVGWKDRVLTTYHFDRKQVITFGSHPKNDIVIASLAESRVSQPLIVWDTQPNVLLSPDMEGEHSKSGERNRLSTLIQKGTLTRAGNGHKLPLGQDELIRIDFADDVSLYIRYTSIVPKAIGAPLLMFTTSELTTLIASTIFMGVVGLYMAIYSPPPSEQQQEEVAKEPERKAVFVYKKQPKMEAPPTQAEVTNPVQDTAKKTQGGVPIKMDGDKPAEAKPNNSQSKKQILTAQNVGKGNGSPQNKKTNGQPTTGGSPSPRPDVRKSGLLGVFGRQGTQQALDKAFQGASEVGSLGQSASGKAGLGMGDNPNATSPGLREVGAGGNGTATIGIAGVGTKGKGGGVVGYGDQGLGGKKGVQIIPGGTEENFEGKIDREAIRRVVNANLLQMKACYERGLNRKPTLAGKLVLTWTIAEKGRVSEAHIKSSGLNDPEVEECALSRLRTWIFPEPPVDRTAEVTYPFVFAAQN